MLLKYGLAKRTIKFTAMFLMFCVLLSSVCAAAGNETNYTTHIVSAGESLSKIANLYGVTMDAIAELNGITDINLINVGDVLKIPGGSGEALTAEDETTAAETTAAETPSDPSYVMSYDSMLNNMSTVISVNFNKTDVRDVLSAFAINLGYNFIFKGSATEVTLNLKDVTIGEALDFVMQLIDMTYITDGRTIIVGQKADLIKSFSEALQLTEFVLTYVTTDVIMSQITALNIAVTTSASGGSQYRFIAQGLPADLSKVRDLIAMIDKQENSMLGPMTVSSYFYTIELKYITAAELQKVLTSISLPIGVVLPLKPQTLYIYAGTADYKAIINITKAVDTKNPELPVTDKEQSVIKQIDLKYVTLDLIESQITDNAEVKIIKINTNKSTFWLNGTLAQIKKAEQIVGLLDTESNAFITSEETQAKFYTISLENITAEQFNSTLTSLSLPTGIIFPDNEKTLFIYATADKLKLINDVKAVVDKPENASAAAATKFSPIILQYITAEQFNSTLTILSLPTGITFPDNKNTLFIYATPDEFASINDVKMVVDTSANAAATNEEIKALFRPISLKYITAEQFNTTLTSLSLPTGIIYPDNKFTLYISATTEQFAAINDVMTVVDTQENAGSIGTDETDVLIRVDLINVNKDFAIPFIGALGFNIKVIDIKNMQKAIWLQGPQSEVSKAQTSITNIDTGSANVVYSYRTFTLVNISAAEMSEKLAVLNLTNVVVQTDMLSGFSHNVLVSFPNDMEDSIAQIIASLDVQTDYVTLLIDSVDGVYDQSKMDARISLISKMSGIPVERFEISGNISKITEPKYIIYLSNATLAEIKRVREIVAELG